MAADELALIFSELPRWSGNDKLHGPVRWR